MKIYFTLLILLFSYATWAEIDCDSPPLVLPADKLKDMQDIQHSLRCNSPITFNEWKTELNSTYPAFDLTEATELMSSEQAKSYFEYLANTYITDQEYELMLRIILNHGSSPSVRTSILNFVSHYELFPEKKLKLNEKYDDFNTIMKSLASHPLSGEQDIFSSACLPDKIKQQTNDELFQKLHGLVKDYGVNNRLCHFPASITVHLERIKKLPIAQQDDLMNPLYRGMGACLQSLYDVPISKALIFSKNLMKKHFGRVSREIIDSIPDESPGLSLLVSSSKPETSNDIRKSRVSLGGVYLTSIRNHADNDSEIMINGKKIWIKKTKMKAKNIVTPKSTMAPNYAALWKDKKLVGMTFISPNLDEWKDRVSQNYLSYYMDQGFSFDEPVNMKDSSDWIAEKIKTGEIDYILKEAHTAGNDYDLIGLSRNNILLTGRKKLSNGKEEIMHLLVPQDEKETLRISFEDMASWMEERKNAQKGELIYLNSSCWSAENVAKTNASIGSEQFIHIAAENKTTTFSNNPKSTKYHIIDGLRKGKSYPEMFNSMKKTPRFVDGYNDFVLPHDKKFTELFEDLEDVYQVDLYDQNGKLIQLHDQLAD